MMFDLKGQRVLVVGGSSGIGKGAAMAAAEAGAEMMIASRSAARVEAAAALIGHGCTTGLVDICDDASVEDFFAKAGVFDHVLTTAAQVQIAPVKSLSVVEAQASMNSKFWGTYRIARAAKISDGGSLTLTSGAAAVRATKGRALQTAINAGVEALTKGLALEFAPVRVNTVSPGVVETERWQQLDAARLAQVQKIAAHSVTARAGTTGEIAIQILACMVNPFMTGSVVYVEGGYLLL